MQELNSGQCTALPVWFVWLWAVLWFAVCIMCVCVCVCVYCVCVCVCVYYASIVLGELRLQVRWHTAFVCSIQPLHTIC